MDKMASHKVLLFFLIISIGFCIYSNTINSSFHFDDRPGIIDNPAIKSLSNFIGPHFRIRQLITRITFLINYQLDKLEVIGYHIFNILIHIISSILIFYLVKLIFKTPYMKQNRLSKYNNLIALFSSLVFLSHPIQTQSITYIVQRASSLAALFYILTIILYAKARLESSRLYYYLAIVIALLSTLTKEIVITLAFMLLLFEITFFGISKENIKKKLIYFMPFFLPIVIIPLLLLADLENVSTITKETLAYSRTEYLLTQFNVIRTYIRLLFLPIKQNLDYYYPISKSLIEPKTLLSLLLHIMILLFAVKIFKKHRLISFGIFFFYIALSVESSIIPISDVIFEHRLYLPMVGFSLFIVPSLFLVIKNTKIFTTLLTILVVTLSILTYNRNKVWKDDFSLWHDAVKKSPNKARPHNNLGVEYRKKKLFDKAMKEFKKAIELDPYYADPRNDLGAIYASRGMPDKAMKEFKKAIKIDPSFAKAHNNLGLAYAKKNMLDEAIIEFKKSIEFNPNRGDTYNNLGTAYAKKNMPDEAIIEFEKAIELDPKHVKAYFNLGFAYVLKSDKVSALRQADMLRKLDRDDWASSLEEVILNKINN